MSSSRDHFNSSFGLVLERPASTVRARMRRAGQATVPERGWTVLRIAVDLLVLGGTAGLTLAAGHGESATTVLAFSAAVLVSLAVSGSYRPRLQLSILDDLRTTISVTAIAAMAVITAQALVGGNDSAAGVALHWAIVATALAVARGGVDHAQRHARHAGRAGRATLIVGAGTIGRLAADRLLAHPEIGLRPVAFLDKEPLPGDGPSAAIPVAGASWDLEEVVAQGGIEHVIIAFSTAPHHVLLRLVRRCWQLGVPVSLVPRLFELEGVRASPQHVGALPLVQLRPSNPLGWRFTAKYAVERVIAALILVLLSPLLALIALSVALTTGRPIIFAQLRVGQDGRTFQMLKFRTMVGSTSDAGEADAEWAISVLGERHADGSDVVPVVDRRTPVGRVLRRFTLDELPQLWNVVRGDMALIGPRPERASYVARFDDAVYRYGDRHRVKPGITGWAQVNGLRGESSLADRVEWDNHYVENFSFWGDVKILLLTAVSVLRHPAK